MKTAAPALARGSGGRSIACSGKLLVLNAAAKGPAVGEFDLLASQHGLDGVGDVVLGRGGLLVVERTDIDNLAILIEHEQAKKTHGQVGSQLAGWFQFQPLYGRIVREQPDLLE